MLDSQYNSRLEHPKRRVLTSESIGRSNDKRWPPAIRLIDPLLKSISNTCQARSTSTFLPSQKAKLQSAKQIHIPKCKAARALFSKHKKRIETNLNQKRCSVSTSECSILPNGFSCILKARSTVIRQNKLQEFYINLGEEEKQQKIVHLQADNFKSNFFKPNFAKKKPKAKRRSLHFEKSIKTAEEYQYDIKMGQKFETYSSNLLTENEELILKERVVISNEQKITPRKKLLKNISQILRDNRKSKQDQKQNVEFNLQPWDNEDDDPNF